MVHGHTFAFSSIKISVEYKFFRNSLLTERIVNNNDFMNNSFRKYAFVNNKDFMNP